MTSQYTVINQFSHYGGFQDPGGYAYSHSHSRYKLPITPYSPTTPFFRPSPHHRSYRNPRKTYPKMSSMPPSQEEMADLQRLSDNYVPDLQGPLVGQKQPISTLIAEYANADPVYVQKTAALADRYAHCRVMKGDGNCGWRAIAFTYFETLYRMGDQRKVEAEINRLTALNVLLVDAGFAEFTFSDFVEMTTELLQRTTHALLNGLGEEFLAESFNDEETSGAIIMHLRLLTSAFMKANPDRYSPFLQVPLEHYCSTHLEPFKVEIDNIGMQALMDAVIGPAGFKIEITYLDRTPGSEANTIQLDPITPVYGNPPILHLLFKPDHYDILYVAEDIPRHDIIQVNRAIATETYQPEYDYRSLHDGLDMTYEIPGMSFAFSAPEISNHAPSTMDSGYMYHATPTPVMPTSTATVTSPIIDTPSPLPYTMTSPSPATVSTASPLATMTSPVASPTVLHSPTSPLSTPTDGIRDPIRFVAESHMPMERQIEYHTRPFKESEFNPMHFLNPNFQPEPYDPRNIRSPSRSKKA